MLSVVSGSILFLNFINDMPDKINNMIHLFADGTKICLQLTNQNQTNALQNNIDRLDEWSDRWKLIFNVATCKTKQIGYHITTHTFTRWDHKSYYNMAPPYLCESINKKVSHVNTRLGTDHHQLLCHQLVRIVLTMTDITWMLFLWYEY